MHSEGVRAEDERRGAAMSLNHNVFNNIKNYKAQSIYVKCFVVEIILTLIPFLILSLFYYSDVKKTARNNVINESRYTLSEVGDISDTILNECDMMCTYIANTDRVQMFMLNNWFFENDNRTLGEIDEMIRGFPLIYEYVDSIYVYSEFNNLIYNSGRTIEPEAFSDIHWMEAYERTDNVGGAVVPRVKNNTFPYLITIIKPVIIDKAKRGAVVFNINSSKLYATVSTRKYETGAAIYLTNTDNEVLMSGKGSNFARAMSDIYPGYESAGADFKVYADTEGKEFFISEINSERDGLKYINASPVSQYTESLRKMRTQIILILIGLILLSIVFAFVVSVIIYKPVDEILAVLKDPESFNSEDTKQNELKYIVTNILTNIRANNEMKQELERRLSMLNQSQIRMLQYQINPHFLYNTLETINWMAVGLTDSTNKVSKAIQSLAKLLRNSVDGNGYIVSIESEIEYTNNYLDILGLRYGDMFSVRWELDEDIGEYSIVKICLQPVVENAVYHGLKPKGADGLLIIRGTVFDEYILFEVEDNGVGIDDDELEKMNVRLHSRELMEGAHIGLYNVSHRVRIIFGEEYGVYVEHRENGGTRVGITLPKHKIK